MYTIQTQFKSSVVHFNFYVDVLIQKQHRLVISKLK